MSDLDEMKPLSDVHDGPESLSSDQEELKSLTTGDCTSQVVEPQRLDQLSELHEDVSDVLINGEDLAPVGGAPESALDDDPVSELSQRFVDMLDLQMPNPELVRENAQVNPATDQDSEMTPEEIKNFNESMIMISAYAEDVVKTWFAQIYNRPVNDVFSDGLTNSIGSITMLPGEDMIRRRRQARIGHDEEVRDDDVHEDDTYGWKLRLTVVDSDHRINLDEWKLKDPMLLRQMLSLLNYAWGYIHYAIESYDLPNKDLFIGYDDMGNRISMFKYSPWGTIYIPEAPETIPQIGIMLTKIQPGDK